MTTISRSTLQTRPRIQRILVRSWEYIPAVRTTILTFRLLAVLFLTIVGIVLLSDTNWWGLLMLAVAAAVLPFSVWLFSTGAKGWPAR
jgi:hypothetical protein